jgi:hypothetical protein
MARSQRTKLVLKDLGEPAIIKTLPETVARHMLGTLGGIASGFVERKSPDGTDVYEGLSGSFRSIPSDPAKDELESGVLFIPDAFHAMIATPLREMIKNDPNATLRFAFEVSVIRAKNAAGYSWDFLPKIDAAAANPLDELFDTLGGVKVLEGKRVLAISDKAVNTNAKPQAVAAVGGKK